MTDSLAKLSTRDLETLADALRSGRLPIPCSAHMARAYVSGRMVDDVVDGLDRLASQGFGEKQIAILLDAIKCERKTTQRLDEVIELVTTGPEAPGTTNRDTSVVVRDLFRQANHSVVIAGYAIYQGQQVFESLAQRMELLPELDVKMYLNMPPASDTDVESILVRRFMDDFESKHWPEGCRIPSVFYDPRSIDPDRSKRASLHAKCVVVDDQEVFISSANFTERAQHKNIEVGLRLTSGPIGEQLCRHFASLVAHGDLRPAD